MSTTNHPVIPEEIRTKIESAYPLTPNPTGDRHIKVFNMAQEESRINAGFGYSLAIKELEECRELMRKLITDTDYVEVAKTYNSINKYINNL